MPSTELIAILCVGAAALLAAGTVRAHDAQAVKTAYSYEKRGIMTHQEYLRLYEMQAQLYPGGAVSDADVDFAIHVLETKPSNRRETAFRRSQAVAYGTFTTHRRWTARQKTMLFKAALWLLAQPEPRNQIGADSALYPDVVTDKLPAIWLLQAVHDKRVLPALGNLEHDRNPKVAQSATALYQRIAGSAGKKQSRGHSRP